MNLTNPEYWSNHWKKGDLPKELNIEKSFSNYSNYNLHLFFKKVFEHSTDTMKIIEVGCGDSILLPYFYNKFNLNIYGIDYSNVACERSIRIIENSNAKGDIKLMDLFKLETDYLNVFDFVYSGGVIEHFEDNTIALCEMKKMLSKDGLLITGIPNMTGLNFFLLKYLNKKVFDTHNIFGIEEFKNIHKKCDLEITSIIKLPISLYIPLDGIFGWKKRFVKILNKFLILISRFSNYIGLNSLNYLSSGYIITSCTK